MTTVGWNGKHLKIRREDFSYIQRLLKHNAVYATPLFCYWFLTEKEYISLQIDCCDRFTRHCSLHALQSCYVPLAGYPPDLSQLTPRGMSVIPSLLRGQVCYRANKSHPLDHILSHRNSYQILTL
jgi:hypothetical protein